MKEATGELNMTVVTVVAIAAVAAFFYAFVWPGIRNSIQANTYCSMAYCEAENCKMNGNTNVCTGCKAYEGDSEVWSGTCRYPAGEGPANGE